MDGALARYWHRLEDGRIQCDLCPRHCRLADGQRAFCFVRRREGDELLLDTYGRSTGFCVDPIEKKPLYHFLPGTPVLSFGTAGCNLGCRYCQNWDTTKAREVADSTASAAPAAIALAARDAGCRSVAFTYNDPVIWAEYAIDTAEACHALDLRTVAVTAGYIGERAREDFFAHIDAANIDLKSFSETFYERLCFARLAPVLDTIAWVKAHTRTWLEITTLVIPGENDSDDELRRLSRWCVENLGPTTPLHFSAFHPDFKMLGVAKTPPATLRRAREIARDEGALHVYCGNVHDRAGDTTSCNGCGEELIVRDWFEIVRWNLVEGRCPKCRHPLAGVFEPEPGRWGARRLPIEVGR